MKSKPFYKSWVIGLTAIPMVIEIINLALEQPFVPDQYKGAMTFVTGILVILARLNSSGAKIGK